MSLSSATSPGSLAHSGPHAVTWELRSYSLRNSYLYKQGKWSKILEGPPP